MIRITDSLSVDERELEITFVRAGGPGGQNVNKVSTAVQLRFDVGASPSLPAEVKERLKALAGSRLTAEGVLRLDARGQRSQAANRQEVIDRLAELLRRAARRPRRRRATAPTLASRQRRIEAKKRRGQLKRRRRGQE